MRGAFALATIMMLGGCAQATQVVQATMAPPSGAATTQVSYGPDVVHLQGVRDVRFGDTRSDLDAKLNKSLEGCNEQVTGMPQGSLVFAPDNRLVLIWFDSPLHTPEGVGTGSTVEQVRAAYPQAEELKAPAASYRFDGLLVSQGDRGYLFLHDGHTVKKAVAGYTDYLNRLFNTGFGVC